MRAACVGRTWAVGGDHDHEVARLVTRAEEQRVQCATQPLTHLVTALQICNVRTRFKTVDREVRTR